MRPMIVRSAVEREASLVKRKKLQVTLERPRAEKALGARSWQMIGRVVEKEWMSASSG